MDGIFDESFETIEPAEFEVLSLLSVLNRPVSLKLLRPAAALPFDALAPILATLRRKGFIQRVWSEGEHQYNVRHHRARDQIYAGLTGEVAVRLHGRALEAIELVHGEADTYLEDLAHHALASRHLEKGIRFTRLAADHARRLFDSKRATMLYLRAHALVDKLGQGPVRDQLEIGLAIAIASASYYSASEENIERLKRALSLAIVRKDVEAEAGVQNAMGRTYYGLGRQREAIPCFREYIRLTEGKGDDMTRALPYSVLGRVYFFLAKFGDAAEYLERASALFERQKGADEELSYALGMGGSARCYLGDLGRGLAQIDRSIAVAERIRHETRLALGHTYRGICLANHGKWQEASKWLEDGLERSQRTGDVIAIGTGSSFLGLTHLMEGRVERAIELIRFGQEQIAGLGGTWTFTMICAHLIEALLAAGQLDLAVEQEALGKKVLDTGERWGESCLSVSFAHLQAARHDERGALDWFQRAVSAASEQRALPFLAKALLARGIHLAERGDGERSREDLEMARRLLERLSMSYHEKKAISALAGEHVTACL
jgi:tetratricopeptide (TPR) repeat protein